MNRHALLAVGLALLLTLSGCSWLGTTETPTGNTTATPPPTDPSTTPQVVSPPNVTDRRASGLGSAVVDIRPGISFVEGYSYEYATRYDGTDGRFVLTVRDAKPTGELTVRVAYNNTTTTESELVHGAHFMDVLGKIEVAPNRLFFHTAASFPYGNATQLTPNATIGDSWTLTGGSGQYVAVTAVGVDMIGSARCLQLSIESEGENVATACYSPTSQLLVSVSYHGDEGVTRHLELVEIRN